jgi:hypothetical protein
MHLSLFAAHCNDGSTFVIIDIFGVIIENVLSCLHDWSKRTLFHLAVARKVNTKGIKNLLNAIFINPMD